MKRVLSLVLPLWVIACAQGSEIDVHVSTDVPCTSISAIVSLIHPNDAPASGAQTFLGACTNGTFGTAVYHPDSTTPNDVVIAVASVDGSDPTKCLSTPPPTGCIVARHLTPVSTETSVSILLQSACVDVACDATTTCNNGVCVGY
jgi:hypothetical protein